MIIFLKILIRSIIKLCSLCFILSSSSSISNNSIPKIEKKSKKLWRTTDKLYKFIGYIEKSSLDIKSFPQEKLKALHYRHLLLLQLQVEFYQEALCQFFRLIFHLRLRKKFLLYFHSVDHLNKPYFQ